MTAAGFPHSGITGSTPACGSPMLFAAYHALLRLSVPRHPPCALVRLTGNSSPDRPRSTAHLCLDLHDFSSACIGAELRIRFALFLLHTRRTLLASLPGCLPPHPNGKTAPRRRRDPQHGKNRVRCSPRPLLHTTLNPICQFSPTPLPGRPVTRTGFPLPRE